MLKGKHIILGISGGIAAYKSVFLLRLLVKAGAEVQVIITPNGKEFITPVTLSSLSGKPVISEFFTANTGEWHSHVDLGLWADLMIIAPATASTIAKMANGVADNMLITSYLSSKAHVMIAPAMDLDMWAHPSTQRNIDTLIRDGVEIISPADGELASHLVGKGRMEEPQNILRAIENYFIAKESSNRKDLEGKKVLVTAGPTHEKIDPVRFIGNYSSGKMGFAIAAECALRGADVTLIAGPVDLPIPSSDISKIDVTSALEMHDRAINLAPHADIAIFSAAVADYRPEVFYDSKIKRENNETPVIRLVKNPDIAADCGRNKRPGQVFVGFALETDNELENARTKLAKKNLDLVVLNSLRDPGAGFRTDTNKVTIVSNDQAIAFPLKSKKEVAVDIVDRIVLAMNNLKAEG